MSLEQRFFNLYRGLERARGKNKVLKTTTTKGKRDSSNQTLHEPYTIGLWSLHLHGGEGLGVIPINDNAECVWGAIDVDIYPLDLVELEQKVRELDLPFVVLRTKSGGAHLTAYWSNWQSAAAVRAKMAEASFALGLGERELYPKQVKLASKSDIGNWLNMPYFNYEETERYAVIDGEPASVEEFLNYAESIRLESVEEFVVPTFNDEFDDGPPCIQQIVRNKAGQGERNNVLFNLGVYAKVKFESEWESYIDKYNHAHIEPPLNHREVGAIVKSLEKKSYSYTCNNSPLCNNCNRETCKSRKFGIHAFQHIDVGIAFDSISKMNSQPPIWVLSLEGVRTEVETEDLLSQERFRAVCVNAINKIPGRMKGEDWDKFMRLKLSEIEIIDVPREVRITDRVVDMLPRFFASTPSGNSSSDLTIGRWVANDDSYYFRPIDFILFLNRNEIKPDMRKIWPTLMDVGVKVASFRNQPCWSISNTVYSPTSDRKLAIPPRKKHEEDF